MSFVNPIFLYLMLPPLGVLAYFILSGSANYEKYFSKEVLDKILIKGDFLGSRGRNYFLLMAIFAFIIALARPVMNVKEVKISSESKNLVIAIDVSRSMSADDIYPNRLEFVKHKLSFLIDNLKDTNIGIVAFARNAFLVSPITNDKNSLKFLLSNLSSDMVSVQGTDVSNALTQVSKMFVKSGLRDVFLVSDGGESKDIQKAIAEAKKSSLHVSVMVVGSQKGGTIKLENGELLKDKNLDIVISKRNEKLKALALETSGVYIKEFGSGEGVRLLEKSLKKIKTNDENNIKIAQELFMYPLILGLIFICIALHGFNKKTFAFVLPFLFITPSHAGVLDFLHVQNAKGALEKKEYQKAIDEYNKLAPTPKITYNKANAYYKMKKYDEALSEYKKIKTDNKNFKSKILFNKGNSHVQKKEYKDALKEYEKAKKLTPDDKDIDKNIEYVKKKMQEKKKQNQDKNQQNKDNKNNQDNKNKQNKDKKKSDQNKKDKQNGSNEKEEKQDKKNSTEKDKQNPKKEDENQTKTKQSFGDLNKSLDDMESKKWEKILRQMSPRTRPIMMGEAKGAEDEITW